VKETQIRATHRQQAVTARVRAAIAARKG